MTQTPITPPDHGFALCSTEGEACWWESQLFRIKCSSAGLGFVEGTLEQGSEPPMHVHTREDEYMFVLDGELTAWIGDDVVNAAAGGFVYMPKNIPHTFGVDGHLCRVLLAYTPSGFERVFWDHRTADYVPGVPGPKAARHDMAVLGDAFTQAGLTITGPHPRDVS